MTRKYFYLFLFLLLAGSAIGQTSKNIIVKETLRVYSDYNVERPALFADCHLAMSAPLDSLKKCSDQNLQAYLNHLKKTPALAKKYNISKTVYIDAIVLKNGLLVNLRVDNLPLKNLSKFQKEAVRLVNSMNEPRPLWSPAIKNGRPVNGHVKIAVQFGNE